MLPILFPVTYKCNLNCVYCHQKRDKEVDYWKSVDTILSLPNEWVFITGGEPLLVPDIIKVCDTLRLAGKKVGLTTNGTINIPSIAYHLDRLGVSLDGGEDITDKNRGIGTYSAATSFIKSVVGKTETVLMVTRQIEYGAKQVVEATSIGSMLNCTHIQITDEG